MRKQEIRLFLYHTTKCPTKAEKTECEKWVNNNIIVDFGRLNETKYNWILYLRKEWKMKMEKSEEHIKFSRKSINQIISKPYSWQTIIALRRQDESCKSKRGQKEANFFEINSICFCKYEWYFEEKLSRHAQLNNCNHTWKVLSKSPSQAHSFSFEKQYFVQLR